MKTKKIGFSLKLLVAVLVFALIMPTLAFSELNESGEKKLDLFNIRADAASVTLPPNDFFTSLDAEDFYNIMFIGIDLVDEMVKASQFSSISSFYEALDGNLLKSIWTKLSPRTVQAIFDAVGYVPDSTTSPGETTNPVTGETTTAPEPTTGDLKERREVVELFNKTVNSAKKDFPKFRYSEETGLLVGKQQTGVWGLAGEFSKWLNTLVGGFTDENTLTGSFGNFFKPTSNVSTVDVARGQDCTDIVPVKGKSYVSNLSPDDPFEYEYTKYTSGAFTIKIKLPDMINPNKNSVYAKVFNLQPVDMIYSAFYSMDDSVDWEMIQIKYTNAYIECSSNAEGQLYGYNAHYENSIVVLTKLVEDLRTISFPGSMYLSDIKMSNVSFSPRPLGDCDADGIVSSKDARLCLRASADLITVSKQDFMYYDVIKDGVITSGDARTILRVSALLDKI